MGGLRLQHDGADVQLHQIVVNPDNQPTVLTADFNKMLDSPIFDGVKKFMADARTTAPVTDNKASFNNFGGATNYPRIDHIFSSGFTPLRFATVDQRYEKGPQHFGPLSHRGRVRVQVILQPKLKTD